MTFDEFVTTLDHWGNNRVPFFFLVDFEQRKPIAFRLEDLPPYIDYNFNGKTNYTGVERPLKVELRADPVAQEVFKERFDCVYSALEYGDSYLLNLTFRNAIQLSVTLPELFPLVTAKYKLLYKNDFLVFSPEIFVQVKDGVVYSFPMKGTIDASVEKAEQRILADEKELAEHVTIVDLIRNDLSLIAEDVTVTRFRYIDRIESNQKQLLQVSSEIRGKLFESSAYSFGSMLKKLLPAGSISGAPKKKTVEIIQQTEGIDRGYYTGVAGIFDGRVFDSGVLIRFIENENGKLFYRSGGGITTASDWQKEYREVIDKIYVPVI